MKKVLFNPIANAFVLAGAWTGFFFAFSLLAYKDPVEPGWRWSIYLWALAVIFFPFFYPIKKLGVIRIIFAHYLVNAIIMIGVSVWCYFREPGYIPGFCYSVAGLLYLIAFIRGEKTVTIEDLKSGRV